MNDDRIATVKSRLLHKIWFSELLDDNPTSYMFSLARSALGLPGEQKGQCVHYPDWDFNGDSFIVILEDWEFQLRLHFPSPGPFPLREETLVNEANFMRFLFNQPGHCIPISEVLASGIDDKYGPFMIHRIQNSKKPTQMTNVLYDTPDDMLPGMIICMWFQMANILVDLAEPAFNKIGSITQDETTGTWKVSNRLISQNMNRSVTNLGISPSLLPKRTYETANEYFKDMAEQHFIQLEHQLADAFQDEEECRRQYIARCLFKKIAPTISTKHNNGPFRLYSDNLCFDSVMVDDTRTETVCVEYWRFTYSAPAEFTYVMPWWALMTDVASRWKKDLNAFWAGRRNYCEAFLTEMRRAEDLKELEDHQRLSTGMAESLDSGLFWLCLAARDSTRFDDIYWQMLDEKYFGPFTTLEDRVGLLEEDDRERLDSFVAMKMGQGLRASKDFHITPELDRYLAANPMEGQKDETTTAVV